MQKVYCSGALVGLMIHSAVIFAQQGPADEAPSDFLRRSGVQVTLDRLPVTNVERLTRLNLSLFREAALRTHWSLRGEVGVSLLGWNARADIDDSMAFLRATPFASLELRNYRTPRKSGTARTFWAWKNTIQPRQGVNLMGDETGLSLLYPLEFRTALIVGRSKDLGPRGHLEYGAGVEGSIRSYSNGITNTRLSPVFHLRYGLEQR